MRIFAILAMATLVATCPTALPAQDEPDEQQSQSGDQPPDESEQISSGQDAQAVPGEAPYQAGDDQSGQTPEASDAEDGAGAQFDSAGSNARRYGYQEGAVAADPGPGEAAQKIVGRWAYMGDCGSGQVMEFTAGGDMIWVGVRGRYSLRSTDGRDYVDMNVDGRAGSAEITFIESGRAMIYDEANMPGRYDRC